MADGLLSDREYLLRRLPWLLLSLVPTTAMLFGALLQSPVPDPFEPTSDSVPTWLRYPIEHNPHLRLPFIDSYLNSVTFTADGRTGWAVGDGGTILKTEDGGETWTPCTSDTRRWLRSVTFTADRRTGWAVGNGGTILKTEDGGETWTPRTSDTTDSLHSVTFASDGTTGWAVGNGGTILKTEDGGETWTPRTSDTTDSLHSVTFASDGTTGWAVGNGGTILKTEDGGETWTRRTSDTSQWLRSVTFTADGTAGWAVGNGGTILKTEDGGETWTRRTSDTSQWLRSVTFTADGTAGWAVGNGGTILKTEDGGETWTRRTSDTTTQLGSVTFTADGTTGWAVGWSGTILKTEDGGETWAPRTSGTKTQFRSVTFTADGTTGWAVGLGSTILKTEDGGETWTRRTSGTSQWLRSVTFTADGTTGWAVGNGGTILKTEDGGETWTRRTSDTTAELHSVTFTADGRAGWAVGDRGTILKTEDGGETWTRRTSDTTAELHSVTFTSDGTTGWAGGWGGTILKTEDGGETWTRRTSGTTDSLFSVTFTSDGTTGWAVGTTGTILKTEDGGETWASRTSDTRRWLRSVTFTADGTTGWAVGNGGTILKTEDGGETWTSRTSNTTVKLYSVRFMGDGTTGWAVGTDAILLTTNGGETWRPLSPKADYRIYPAPLTWIAFVCALLALLPAARRLPATPAEGIADTLVSDQPLEFPRQDVLKRGYIYRGLASFLSNENTEPPLTIAIIGDWGQGKSSLMRLLRTEMMRHSTSAVWFNAWHHQKEQHLFAALLRAVRDQAVPRLLTRSGLRFRWRLFWSRVFRHWMLTSIAVVTFVAWLSNRWHNDIKLPDLNFVTTFVDLIIDKLGLDLVRKQILSLTEYYFGPAVWFVKDHLFPFVLDVVLPYAPFLCVVIIAFLFPVRLHGWKFNPDRLLSNVSKGTLRLRGFSPQLGFRQRFSDAFEEVTKALQPGTLLIVIDDLDRCHPEQVVETLEAVNFLVHAGRCYVVMGIAKEQVLSCVGLGFKDIAEEMGNTQGNGKAKRREYARNYLDKLINLEVLIPKLDDSGTDHLVSPNPHDYWRAVLERLRSLSKTIAIGITVLALSIYVGYAGMTKSRQPTQSASFKSSSLAGQTVQTISALAPETQEPSKSENNSPSNPGVRPGSDLSVSLWRVFWTVVVLGILLLVVASHILQRYLERSQDPSNFMKLVGAALDEIGMVQRRVQDSPAFTEALKIWLVLVREATNSPRHVKRFINRVRYLAMISSSSESSGQARSGDEDKFSDSILVALAALQSFSEKFLAGEEEQLLKLTCLFASDESPDDRCEEIELEEIELEEIELEEIELEEIGLAYLHHYRFTRDWIKKLRDDGVDTFSNMDDDRVEQTTLILIKAFIAHQRTFPKDFPKKDKARKLISRFREMASGIVVR